MAEALEGPRGRRWIAALARRRGTVSAFITVAGGNAAGRVLSFATQVWLANRLAPAQFGEFSVFFVVLTVVWTSTVFLNSTYVHFASRLGEQPEARADLLLGSLAALALFAALLGALAWPLSGALASALGQPGLSGVVLAAIAGGLCLTPLTLLSAVHQARERFLAFAAWTVLFYALAFVGVGAAILGSPDFGTAQAYRVYLGASALCGGLGVLALARRARVQRLRRPALGEQIRFGRWLFAENLSWAVYQRLDLLLLTKFTALATVGQYSAALRIVVVVGVLTGSVRALLQARASRAGAQAGALRSYLGDALLVSGGIVAFTGVVWLAAPWLIERLFGEAYAPAGRLARILLVAPALGAVTNAFSLLFYVQNRPQRLLRLGLTKLATLVVLGLALIPSLAATGAACAYVGAELSGTLFTLAHLRRHTRSARGGAEQPPARP